MDRQPQQQGDSRSTRLNLSEGDLQEHAPNVATPSTSSSNELMLAMLLRQAGVSTSLPQPSFGPVFLSQGDPLSAGMIHPESQLGLFAQSRLSEQSTQPQYQLLQNTVNAPIATTFPQQQLFESALAQSFRGVATQLSQEPPWRTERSLYPFSSLQGAPPTTGFNASPFASLQHGATHPASESSQQNPESSLTLEAMLPFRYGDRAAPTRLSAESESSHASDRAFIHGTQSSAQLPTETRKRPPESEPTKSRRVAGPKKPSKKKGKSDKPHRPLSAYNFFFKEQREKLLKDIPSPDESSSDPATSMRRNKNPSRGKPHGKISFESLAKAIGEKWETVKNDPTQRQHYQDLADRDKERYNAEIDVWKRRQSEALTAQQRMLEQSVGEQAKEEYFESYDHGAAATKEQKKPPPK